MGEVKQFKLPDLGEGLTEGDILKWLVAEGDTVAVNDLIAEVETVKAAVELPSPFAGVVTALHAAEGETVAVGAPIISIDVAPDSGAAPAGGNADSAAAEVPEPTLVGYGPQEGSGRRRRRRSPLPVPSAHTAFNIPPSAQSLGLGAEPPGPAQPAPSAGTEPMPAPLARTRAKPPVRKLAKELGVDLDAVPATGPNGTVSRDDVRAAAGHGLAGPEPATRETRAPVKGVRRHTAAAMVASAFTAPHVTEFVTVDVTAMMQLRDRVAARPEFREVKVSPLLFLAKAVILAVRRTPEINATWDETAGEIVYKHYVNLGIAAATDRGLIVPNIKDAERLSLLDLAQALATLTETARAGRTPPQDMAGGTITITNVGVFGVDTGTPILNPGEAGIVAFGAVRRMPWVVGSGDAERIEPRWVTQLAVSFDHRLVDGQQGSRFLADVAAVLSDPGMALL
jgi:pyruvate dehydrogenase E2 component (dihydrolipoamide acetyltransferase)